MKTGSCLCPVCNRGTLTEVVGKAGHYWRCLNRDCGRAFLPEELSLAGSDTQSDDKTTSVTGEHLESNKRYRIPTTAEGQIYELRRMFRL